MVFPLILFSCTFFADEGIIQSMMTEEEPCKDYHHRSHLLDHSEGVSNEPNHLSIVDFLSNFVFIDTVDSEQNLSNIEEPFLSTFRPNLEL